MDTFNPSYKLTKYKALAHSNGAMELCNDKTVQLQPQFLWYCLTKLMSSYGNIEAIKARGICDTCEVAVAAQWKWKEQWCSQPIRSAGVINNLDPKRIQRRVSGAL